MSLCMSEKKARRTKYDLQYKNSCISMSDSLSLCWSICVCLENRFMKSKDKLHYFPHILDSPKSTKNRVCWNRLTTIGTCHVTFTSSAERTCFPSYTVPHCYAIHLLPLITINMTSFIMKILIQSFVCVAHNERTFS